MEQREIWRFWPWRWESGGHEPEDVGSHPTLEEIRNEFFSRASPGLWPCWHLGLGPTLLWPPENKFHWVCGNLLEEINTCQLEVGFIFSRRYVLDKMYSFIWNCLMLTQIFVNMCWLHFETLQHLQYGFMSLKWIDL